MIKIRRFLPKVNVFNPGKLKKSKSVGAGLDLPPNQPTQSCLPLYICARLAVKSKMARIDLI